MLKRTYHIHEVQPSIASQSVSSTASDDVKFCFHYWSSVPQIQETVKAKGTQYFHYSVNYNQFQQSHLADTSRKQRTGRKLGNNINHIRTIFEIRRILTAGIRTRDQVKLRSFVHPPGFEPSHRLITKLDPTTSLSSAEQDPLSLGPETKNRQESILAKLGRFTIRWLHE